MIESILNSLVLNAKFLKLFLLNRSAMNCFSFW